MLLRYAGLGSLAQSRQLGITALTTFWLQQAPGQNIARKNDGPYFMGYVVWMLTKEWLVNLLKLYHCQKTKWV